ncbi:hypothetical protein EK21DRAFT_85646 [Setomelanomma holmii]|uniref:Uncharacterized protein n=1 Tax=Setomelanomma holmii TaxID=210430 RepID=A0A9P4HIJ1_9PLEO|nr:hypothetical protein EK21DRAFT_85646 [Setomelanomma holmii]
MITAIYRYEHTHLGEALFRYRPPRLAYLLNNLASLHATNSRDRVYAVLSMAAHGRYSGITTGYSKSVTTIYVETACALLKLNWVEIVLFCAITSEHYSGLRSWVPNWSARKQSVLYASVFDACKGKEQQKATTKSFSPYSLCVKLDGYLVGTIETMAQPFWEFAFQTNGTAVAPSVSWRPWLELVEHMVSSTKGAKVDQRDQLGSQGSTSSSDLNDMITRLLIADTISYPEIDPLPNDASGFYAFITGVDARSVLALAPV